MQIKFGRIRIYCLYISYVYDGWENNHLRATPVEAPLMLLRHLDLLICNGTVIFVQKLCRKTFQQKYYEKIPLDITDIQFEFKWLA